MDTDERRRALPLIVDGSRIGTVLVPADTERAILDALQDRVVPALETLVGAARRRNELEAQVIETKALRRSNVVKTTLLRSVSHDLRSPLTAITTAAGGLGSATLSEDERTRADSVIETESARLVTACRQPARPHPPAGRGARTRTPTGARSTRYSRRRSTRSQGPDAGFDVDLDPNLPLVRADAAQLERAFANVLENASRFAGSEPVSIRGRAADKFVVAADIGSRSGDPPGGARARV